MKWLISKFDDQVITVPDMKFSRSSTICVKRTLEVHPHPSESRHELLLDVCRLFFDFFFFLLVVNLIVFASTSAWYEWALNLIKKFFTG